MDERAAERGAPFAANADAPEVPVRLVPGRRWFPKGHPARRLHADPSALVGELSGLLLRILDPRCAAVVEASGFSDDPWGAVQASAQLHHVIVNGPIDDGVVAISRDFDLRADAVGYDETGSYYWGADRDILAWAHQSRLWAVLGANRSHSTRPLDLGEAEAAVADWAPVARLAGVCEPATTLLDLNSFMRSRVHGLRTTALARAYAQILLAETDPELAQISLAALSTLPSSVRRHFGAECMIAARTGRASLSGVHHNPFEWDVPAPIAAPSAMREMLRRA